MARPWYDPEAPPFPFATDEFPPADKFNKMLSDLAFLRDPPYCHAFKTPGVPQGIPNVTWTTITLDQAYYDTDDMKTSDDRLTIKTTGRYAILGSVYFEAPASPGMFARGIRIQLNSAVDLVSHVFNADQFYRQSTSIATVRRLVAGAHYIQLQAWQNSGDNPLNSLAENDFAPHLAAYWVGD